MICSPVSASRRPSALAGAIAARHNRGGASDAPPSMPAIPEAPARDETAQPAALQCLRVLDLLPGPACDDIALLAAQICAAPISLVVLTGGEGTRVKARVGLDADQADRALAFVGNAGAADAAFFVVEEAAQDARFHADPLVIGAPHIRFCAGARLATAGGQVLGTVCVFDTESRAVSAAQQRALQALARQTTALLEARLGAVAAEQAAVDSRRQIELLVRADTLTGLPNRRQVDESLRGAMLRTRRTMRPMAVMFLDIDHFKAINDSLGHAGGDAVLREVARRLGASVRATDLVGRLAGDEFVLVLEGIDGVLELGRLADKIVACVRPRIEVEGAALAVTVSLGVAIYRGAEQSAADVLALADAALQQAKQQGRNRFSLA